MERQLNLKQCLVQFLGVQSIDCLSATQLNLIRPRSFHTGKCFYTLVSHFRALIFLPILQELCQKETGPAHWRLGGLSLHA